MCHIYLQWNNVFRSEYTFFIYTEKRKEEKIWIWIIVLATQNSMNKKKVSWLIIRNTNRFEYYIIQQLFNDANSMFLVDTQKTFLMRMYSSRLNILRYFFHSFIFLGANIKGTIFSGRVRWHPSHPPELCVCCLSF